MLTEIRLSTVIVGIRVQSRLVPIYQHAGHNFVETMPGQQYAPSVRNTTGRRLEVLVSVNGRNTETNEPAHIIDSIGMVVQPGGQWVVNGFQLDDGGMESFIFAPDEAYTDSSPKLSTIGVAVYHGQHDGQPALTPAA